MALPSALLSRQEQRHVLSVLRRLNEFYDVWITALILGLLDDGVPIEEIRAAQTEGRLPPAFCPAAASY